MLISAPGAQAFVLASLPTTAQQGRALVKPREHGLAQVLTRLRVAWLEPGSPAWGPAPSTLFYAAQQGSTSEYDGGAHRATAAGCPGGQSISACFSAVCGHRSWVISQQPSSILLVRVGQNPQSLRPRRQQPVCACHHDTLNAHYSCICLLRQAGGMPESSSPDQQHHLTVWVILDAGRADETKKWTWPQPNEHSRRSNPFANRCSSESWFDHRSIP